jgi:hypothetical protein
MNYIISVAMVNADTKEEEVLDTKEGSRCFFKKRFRYKNYEIQLRLDHNRKPDEPPMLDADIDDITTGEHLSSKRSQWHHTEAKRDDASKTDVYTFKFDGLELRLSIITTAATDQLFKVTVGKPKS